jgi:hypothetical protein
MSESVEFLGRPTDDGHFRAESPKALAAFLAARARHGKERKKDMLLRVTIEDWKPTRTNQQNRAWFGIVVKLFCEHMGHRYGNAHEKEFVHEQILINIGHCETVRSFHGELKERALPTHDLEADKFWDLYERAQQLGAEMGIVIPDPERVQTSFAVESNGAASAGLCANRGRVSQGAV